MGVEGDKWFHRSGIRHILLQPACCRCRLSTAPRCCPGPDQRRRRAWQNTPSQRTRVSATALNRRSSVAGKRTSSCRPATLHRTIESSLTTSTVAPGVPSCRFETVPSVVERKTPSACTTRRARCRSPPELRNRASQRMRMVPPRFSAAIVWEMWRSRRSPRMRRRSGAAQPRPRSRQ